MTEPFYIPEEIKENYRYALRAAREDRPRYLNWIKNEIEIAITLINQFDNILVIGAMAAKLIKATPTLYNQFLENYEGEDAKEVEDEKLQEDDNAEVLLEYVMNLATASPNLNKGIIPSEENITAIYEQLGKIKININFWELSAENPADGNENDHWLKTMIVQDTINVRGQGYFEHVKEIYKKIFEPHNDFINQYYGFTATELFETILKLDQLVYSKIGNPYGFIQSQSRLNVWGKDKGYNKPGGFFPMPFHFREFGKDNPDLFDEDNPDYITFFDLSNISHYNRIFWVIPQTEKEQKIFARIATPFGGNSAFFDSKFKGFPQGDSVLKQQPLIKQDDKYYHFSLTLAFRNVFQITEEMIRSASEVYYENFYRSNARPTTKDNRIEEKAKEIFQQMLSQVFFYSSVHYHTFEDGKTKDNELDILGVGGDTLYIIEVKAGELNIKSRRGALKGMKDKLKETIGKGSYQCYRAENYIHQHEEAAFIYTDQGKLHTLKIKKEQFRQVYKITVLLEQLSMVSNQLNHLIEAGIVSPEYTGTWIVSIYDLMVFRDIIETETDFTQYLDNRMQLYEREDIFFLDEIDILGYFLDGNFPLGPVKENEVIQMTGFDEDIKNYYTSRETGFPKAIKPKRKNTH